MLTKNGGNAMAISAKVSTRITTQLKKYQSVLSNLQKRDVSEADTVTVINDMLSDICGYDKYLHVTSQYAIRGTYVDLAVKVDEEIRFLIEVKAIGIELKDAHVKQAIDYAANEGIEWVVLTNGANWRIYKVHFGQPIEKILVCELDAIGTSARSPEALECFGNLSREAFSKGTMAEFLLHKQVTNKFTVAAVLQTDFILEVLRREIRRMSSGVKVEVDYLRSLLRDEVLKRDLVEGDEAKAASQNIRRLQRAATRKKSPSKATNESPILAPVEDASSSLPRAVVSP
ncbi:type I restriction enzyme HsdR N-terminal domain-containing protein [Bradyrhizobium sp. AUGA SZCCT0169]|uniref:type I restriction enzyme HsdR N-terminal domain-containing protein n=1 Tax=Bradyrhizobium sp. AUGA SZCCT0169 TaxID=2807663 RepID=UPI001BAC3F0B|nr:type I restriction enzyme HsdR N-terminal domain-containing protein [Bradyrhizobium sp. AUGA SZCCT0169]MBR1246831.1 type I restriction enzyme HsdR N-terminal domain-containing protein [Bradyrhizobium sp. AUGA SZCCT0169]